MKRSTHVAAPLLAAAALAITTGCEKPQMQRCVDENNKVVDDHFCANLPTGNQIQQNFGSGYIPLPRYHYYYGGWGGYGLGSVVGGGGYVPAAGRSYTTRSGITTRGGFGSSFSEGGSHSSSGSSSGHGGGAGE